MKAITIKEPYATLIKEGYKEYEFRTWKTSYRGDILIHSAKSYDKSNLDRFKDRKLEYNPGRIIAKATITDCIEVDKDFCKKMINKDKEVYKNLSKKRDKPLYGFKLENIEIIDPIEVKGQLGLWEYKEK